MLDSLRGSVRPLVTMILTLAIVAFVAIGVAVPDRFWDLVLMALAFWFATRQTAKP